VLVNLVRIRINGDAHLMDSTCLYHSTLWLVRFPIKFLAAFSKIRRSPAARAFPPLVRIPACPESTLGSLVSMLIQR
jgi:hypothetical protein